MPDQHKEAGYPEQSTTDTKSNGGGQKNSSAGKGARDQARASNSYPEAIRRWYQEADDKAPWNAIESFQRTTLAENVNSDGKKSSTNGATAGFKSSG